MKEKKKRKFRLEKFDYANYKPTQLEDARMKKVLSTLGEAIAETNKGIRINEVNVFKVMGGRSMGFSVNIKETKKSYLGIAIKDFEFIDERVTKAGVRLLAVRPKNQLSLDLLLTEDKEFL